MKRLFYILALFIVMFCCCISCVVSASANNLDDLNLDIQNSTENIIGAEEMVRISDEESDDLLEHIYFANGFDENDKRKDIELVINSDDASQGNVNSSKSINTESTKRYIYDRMHYKQHIILHHQQDFHIIQLIVFSREKIQNQKN